MLLCVPLTAQALRGLAGGPLRDVAAHAPTRALAEAHGYQPDDEDADFAALTYASVASLLAGPRRLVVTAEVSGVAETPDELGRVTAPRLTWAEVTGLFVDEDAVAGLVAAAREAAAHAADLDAALETGAVQALLGEADLLWYAPEERDAVLAMMED